MMRVVASYMCPGLEKVHSELGRELSLLHKTGLAETVLGKIAQAIQVSECTCQGHARQWQIPARLELNSCRNTPERCK